MIPIQNQKSDVFAKISALKALSEDRNSNNGALWDTLKTVSKDPISFLVDLLKELVGYEQLRDTFAQTISNSGNDLEIKIKTAIKLKLRETINCGMNPNLPESFKYQNDGYNFNLKDIDFLNIFKLDPSSDYGNFIYYDIQNAFNSVDLNTVLYNTIQDEGIEHSWGQQVGFENDIVTFKFNETFGNETNVLNVRASNYYSQNKKLNDFNDDFVDSIDLFPTAQFYSNIIDSVFNNFSQIIQKTESEVELEEKLKKIIDKLIETEPDDIIDDSYFEFTNLELQNIKEDAKLKSLGIKKLADCSQYTFKTPLDLLSTTISDVESSSSFVQIQTIIENSVEEFANSSPITNNGADNYSIRLSIFVELIKNLILTIIKMILLPKLLILIMVNYKIIYGTIENVDIIEILRMLKTFFKEITDTVKGLITSILLKEALKEIKNLQSNVNDKINQELVNNQSKIVLSLLGVTQEIIRLTSNL